MYVVGALFYAKITIPVIKPPNRERIEMSFLPKRSDSLFKVIAPRANPAKYKAPNKPMRKSPLHSYFIVTIQFLIVRSSSKLIL